MTEHELQGYIFLGGLIAVCLIGAEVYDHWRTGREIKRREQRQKELRQKCFAMAAKNYERTKQRTNT